MDEFNSTLSPHKTQPTDTNNPEPQNIDNAIVEPQLTLFSVPHGKDSRSGVRCLS